MSGLARQLLDLIEQARRQGGADAAAAAARAATRRHPRFAPAWRFLANDLLASPDPAHLDEAVAAFREAERLQPGHPPTLVNLAVALRRAGRADDAAALLADLVQARPDFVPAWFNLGNAHHHAGRHDAAARAYRRVLELQPDHAGALRNLANALIDLRRLDDARAVLHAALALERTAARLVALARLEEQRRAPDEARALAEEALTIEPTCTEAHLLLATLERAAGHHDEAITRLQRVVDDAAAGPHRASALVQLGHALDRAGRYHEAFEAFAAGQALLEAQAPDAAARSREGCARIRSWAALIAPTARPAGSPKPTSRPPVFLVGFPRSGTTLLEQLLAAHPDFVTSVERPLLQRALAAAPPEGESLRSWPEPLATLDVAAVERIRTAYAEACAAEFGPAHRRVVDKQPLNLVYADAIDRVFPDARLLVALRDPRDVCLSCFFQDFGKDAAGHFYRLESTVDLYDAVMGHWLERRTALAMPWLEVRYEDLTDDVEGVARRVIEFTGAPWDEGVLEYAAAAARRPVSTPSYHAVTRPVYRTAVARWRAYEDRIRPFLPRLQPCLEAFGYV
ncbi:MAG: sulfotransferase [Phycisphaerales bacterium]|nr:sulfotransferase [Phycisphaerales bacterium]